METEIIDLTLSLEDVIKHTNLTLEGIDERISVLAKENVTSRQSNKETVTLNDILQFSQSTPSNNKSSEQLSCTLINNDNRLDNKENLSIPEYCEIIEISDDELSENERDLAENVTEIKVIEVSECNEDDTSNGCENEEDDLFEETYREMLHRRSSVPSTILELTTSNELIPSGSSSSVEEIDNSLQMSCNDATELQISKFKEIVIENNSNMNDSASNKVELDPYNNTETLSKVLSTENKMGVSYNNDDVVKSDYQESFPNTVVSTPCIENANNILDSDHPNNNVNTIKDTGQDKLLKDGDDIETISRSLDETIVLANTVGEEHGEDNDTDVENDISMEDIRNNLKIQLSNLRSKKKMDILKDVKQKVCNVDIIQRACSSKEETNKKNPELNLTTFAKNEIVAEVKEPVSTTQIQDLHMDEDIPDVFKEIRNIIRKPKYTLPNSVEDSASLKKKVVCDSSLKNNLTNLVNKKIDSDMKASPFISNSLDEFLNDAKLNVSYAIPKSGAEDGLKLGYCAEPVKLLDSKIKDEKKAKHKTEGYKPKTLAEKRRMLEKNKIRDQKRFKKLELQKEIQKRSFVLFKNKKVFVRSKAVGTCLASVESDFIKESVIKRKPSLLKEYYLKTRSPMKYKPGPLCKKYLLQSDYSKWTTEMRTLPKVQLEIMPQLGKPVPKQLIPFVCQWKCELTENQIEFALSAVVSGATPPKSIFDFELCYEHQQVKIPVRKKNVPLLESSCKSSRDDVAQVVEDLIKYVEIKELAPNLIKNDEDFMKSREDYVETKSLVKRRESIEKKSYKKVRRELLRLNCKVVSMEERESEPNAHCPKSYCRLGCVCKSLKCEAIIGLHCQKSSCIFGCSCPKVASIQSNAETADFLSANTVSRIEDEAKKHLAKVEKEFTQTIIYANDSTIVVGAVNKARRAARAPKKYIDFFDEEMCQEGLEQQIKEPLIKPCRVSLNKWDFSDITPYCWVHNIYSCYCEGFSTPVIEIQATAGNNIKKQPSSNSKQGEKRHLNIEFAEPLYSLTGRPLRKKKPTFKQDFTDYEKEDYINTNNTTIFADPSESLKCSRTTTVSKKYLEVKKYRESATAADFCNNITEADVLKLKLCKKIDMLESDRLKNSIIEEKRKLYEAIQHTNTRKHQRKQLLEVREDIAPDTLNRKKLATPVFSGEIIVTDSYWLKKLCNNGKQPVDSYARILPWLALYKGFLSKTINVYCVCDAPLRLLLNVGPKILGDNIVNIETSADKILDMPLKEKNPWLLRQSQNVRDIIKWLHSGVVMPKYKPNSLSFLLVETLPGQFEVRGLCTQNETMHNLVEDEEATEIKHKNMEKEIKSLFITKENFQLTELVEEGFDDDLTDNLYMWVGLPRVNKIAKWRMIFLNNDFSYLYFKNIKYSIKYTDLIKLTEMAKEENFTLLIRNWQIKRSYHHVSFGLYISPKYNDRIFIGPYFLNHSEEDIETLQLIKNSLVSTASLNKMKGNTNAKCGHWMCERSYCAPSTIISKETIDLTGDDSTRQSSSLNQEILLPKTSTFLKDDEQIINHNGVPVHIKNSKPRTPSDFNRFIITNIPHFGYLGAYQTDKSSALEVCWPFEKKVLIFENADHARDFLQERFHQLLQPVPETFKIQVIVLIKLDLNEHKPINSDFLTGQCICGYFGVHNFKKLSDEFCQRELNISKDEITKLFAKRAQEYIGKKIAELAEVAHVSKEDKTNYNLNGILKKAKEKIKFYENLRIQHVAELNSIEQMVISKLKTIFDMIKNLPAMERTVESKILNEILQIRPKRLCANEVVTIPDDDSVPVEIKKTTD